MLKKLLVSTCICSAIFAQGYVKEANTISKDLLKTLGGNLKKQLKSGGATKALKYCNKNAMKLTQEVSDKYKNATVKRISLKPRNPKNSPNEKEAQILQNMQSLHKLGAKPRNVVFEDENQVVVYKPLIIKKRACIMCHGAKPKPQEAIKSLYPKDKATGYKMNDFRGAIVVTIKKDK